MPRRKRRLTRFETKRSETVATIHSRRDCTAEILLALQKGFRHIDTAQRYKSEQYVKAALDQWEGGTRSDVFIQSKWGYNPGEVEANDPEASLQESLKLLGTEYIDLYLIHGVDMIYPLTIQEAWKKMEDFHDQGLVKSIGVSAFPAEEIEALSKVWRIKPSVNQMEYHAYCHNLPRMLDMMAICETHDIAIEPFTSLAPLTRWPGGPAQTVAEAIGFQRGIAPAQVLLAWVRQMTGGPIVTKDHQYKEILDSLDLILTQDELKSISKAGREAPQRRRYGNEVWNDVGPGDNVR